MELPGTEDGIREELFLQENLLHDLNQEVSPGLQGHRICRVLLQIDRLRVQGQDVRLKEHALWDVQTGITLLKRKVDTRNCGSRLRKLLDD